MKAISCLNVFTSLILTPTLILTGTFGGALWAQCIGNEEQEFSPAGGSAGDAFGVPVEIDKDVAVIGAPLENGTRGAAYIYRHDGQSWVHETQLSGASSSAGDLFGISASISGDALVVGSPMEGTGRPGSVEFFRFDGSSWIRDGVLSPPGGGADWEFGSSVAIDGDRAVVGARLANGTGEAYVVERSGGSWTIVATLVSSTGNVGDEFGFSVAVESDVIVVGAQSDDSSTTDAGAAYVFGYDGVQWNEEQRLTASDAMASDSFGVSVSLSGSAILVGAFEGDVAGKVDSGAAYVFRHDGSVWSEEQKLVPHDPTTQATFGVGAIDGDVAVIGAVDDDDFGTYSGSAYVFHHNGLGWVEVQKLRASNGSQWDNFGARVDVEGARILIGAPRVDETVPAQGSVYAFTDTDLALDTNATSYSVGDPITITTCGGVPAREMLLVVVDINGIPTFRPILVGSFDAEGRWSLSSTVPPGTPSVTIGLRAFGFSHIDRIGLSNTRTIDF